MKKTVLSVLILTLFSVQLSAQKWVELMNKKDANFYDIVAAYEEEFGDKEYQKGYGMKQFARWKYHWENRINPDGTFPNSNFDVQQKQIFNAKRGFQTLSADHGNWEALGPMDHNQVPEGAGRVQVTAVDPFNSNTIFVGTPGGGLWRSFDGGASWSTNTDEMVSLGVGQIVFDHTNPGVVYMATGDPDGSDTHSTGVLKSTDGGETWNYTALDFRGQAGRQVYDLVMHPSNSQILYAASNENCIHKTTNGGLTWEKIQNFSGANNVYFPFYDLEFKPGNANVIYASNSNGLLKSVDGGTTWTDVFPNLPYRGETRVAVTPAAPNNVYFITTQNNGFDKLFVSTDEGNTFTQAAGSISIGNQNHWNLVLTVSPFDADVVFVGGVTLHKSTNKGASWARSGTGGINSGSYLHVDNHNMIYHGSDIYLSNDGGIYKSTDDGETWQCLNANLNITQFYRLGIYKYDGSLLYAGSQDNGTARRSNGTWEKVHGADGMEAIVNYNDPNVVYSSYQNGIVLRSLDGGESFGRIAAVDDQHRWVTPFVMHPTNPEILYVLYNSVWKTTDGGDNFTQLTALGNALGAGDDIVISLSNPDYLYVLTQNDLVKKTTDGGQTWQDITNDLGGQSGVRFNAIEVDPENPNIVYAVSSSKHNNNVGQTSNLVYKFDGFNSWQDISGSLPNIKGNDLVCEKGTDGGIYLATDHGVYYKNNSMNDWVDFSNNLPNVEVSELEINYESGKIYAATYGRGLLASDLNSSAAKTPVVAFTSNEDFICPGSTVTYNNVSANGTSYSWSFPGGSPSFSSSENPTVTYNSSGTYNVTLTVSNANGSETLTKTDVVTVSGDVISSFPYSQDMEDFIQGDINSGNPGTFLDGWTNDNVGEDEWLVWSGVAPERAKGSNVGPMEDHSANGQKYLIARSFGLTEKSLISPCIDFSNTLNPTFDFWYHLYGAGTNEFSIDVHVDGAWTENVIPSVNFSHGDHWVKRSIDLSSYAGKTIRLRFRLQGGNSTAVALDDFYIYDRQSTPFVTDFFASKTEILGGQSIRFIDQTEGFPSSWSWTFEGGSPSTSSQQNPEVFYENTGIYEVRLFASKPGSSDLEVKTAYINVTGTYNMSNRTVNACKGTLFDSGGSREFYSEGEDFEFVIDTDADFIEMAFVNSFVIDNGDWLKIYDGPTTASPLIGTYSGTRAPAPFETSSGKVTIVFHSDPPSFGFGMREGFELTWNAFGGSCTPSAAPVAEFSSAVTTAPVLTNIQFNDESLNTPSTWYWSFEGGTPSTSSAQNPAVSYGTPGTYNVQLTVTNASGTDVITKNDYITITGGNESFNMSNQTVTNCTGNLFDSGGETGSYGNNESFEFVIDPNNASTVSITFDSWDVENSFDKLSIYDGSTTSSALLGTWSGSNPGTVTANSGAMLLKFTSDGSVTKTGWSASWEATCGSGIPPVAMFTFPRNITVGTPVQFNDASDGNPTSWNWSFNNANPGTSTDQNPSVVFFAAGEADVTLSVANAGGTSSSTQTIFVREEIVMPVADFEANTTSVEEGSSIVFSDLSTGSPTSWLWTFEGGSPATSTGQNPIITYNTPGVYAVTLEVSNTHGSDAETKTSYIMVTDVPVELPVAEFNADVTTIDVGGTVSFTDQSTGNPTSWSWSFEGATPSTSNLQNPSVVYNTPGTYNVSLTAINADGSDTQTKSAFITVNEVVTGDEYLMANQTVTNCSGRLFDSGGEAGEYSNSEDLTFVINPGNASSVSITFDTWDVENNYDYLYIYDGGSTSGTLLGTFSGSNPGTVVANSGAMTLRFESDNIVTKAGWDANWTANCGGQVELPAADFTASTTSIQVGESVSFTDASTGNLNSWSWSFEGATPASSNAQNPVVTYSTAGVYAVSLTVSNAVGSDTETKAAYITVTDVPTSDNYVMSNQTVATCSGRLFDSGGETSNYGNNESLTFVINPANASSVSITFNAWDVENSFDNLYIYEGSSTSGTLIGTYSGTNPGTVISNTGAMTLRFESDGSVSKAGWDATWTANCGGQVDPVVAEFSAENTNVQVGDNVSFTDQSTGNPTSWSWTFEGASPATSALQNPVVSYANAGTYEVSLTVTNSTGTDTETKLGYITVSDVPVSTEYLMSNQTVTACSGRLLDSGGESADYANSEDLIFVINPADASSVSITFNAWDVERNYDFMHIYEGTSTSGSLIGTYSGTNPGTVVSNTGAMTIHFVSDNIVNRDGWDANWSATCGSSKTVLTMNDLTKENNELNVYPNPTNGSAFVRFKANAEQVREVSILDYTGKLVWNKQLNAELDQIELTQFENLAAGVYIIQVLTDGGNNYLERVIKE